MSLCLVGGSIGRRLEGELAPFLSSDEKFSFTLACQSSRTSTVFAVLDVVLLQVVTATVIRAPETTIHIPY
jgi:hypothetical protein